MSLGLKGLRSLMVSYILLSRDALKVNVDVLVHAEKGCWGGGGGGGWVLGWRGGWWEGGRTFLHSQTVNLKQYVMFTNK